MNVLLDESCSPSLRDVIGGLLAVADTAEIAVSYARLAAIDLTAAETASVRCCRVLLGRLDAQELGSLRLHADRARENLTQLQRFLDSGRVEIRSAGMAAWQPDFSVFTRMDSGGIPPDGVCLVGSHYFRVPTIADGPSLTCVLTDAGAVRRARRRFELLWDHAHDVQPAVMSAIHRALTTVAP